MHRVSFSLFREEVNKLYGDIISVLSEADFDEIEISEDDYNKLGEYRSQVKTLQDGIVFAHKSVIDICDEDFTLVINASAFVRNLRAR